MIDASKVTTEALLDFDNMMVECALKVEKIAPLAIAFWSEVLKELDNRGKVQLVSGSYDRIGDAVIIRLPDA